MLGIGSLLLMCSYAGLVTYAFYDIMGCDPIKIKVKKIIINFYNFPNFFNSINWLNKKYYFSSGAILRFLKNCSCTVELAHGMNIPSVNPPKTGPPTIPKIPKAA